MTTDARLSESSIGAESNPQQLCDLLNAFFSHTEPAHEDFNKAVDEFKQRVHDLSCGLVELIRKTHKNRAERCRYSG